MCGGDSVAPTGNRGDSRGFGTRGSNRRPARCVDSYTMLTINADNHPLMSRMHKPDPKLPPDQQDKRSVVSIEAADTDAWLSGAIEDAKALLRPPDVTLMDAGPLE